MASAAIPADAIGPLRTLSRLLWCFPRPGPGTKEMSASSSKPHQWPASSFRPGRLALCGRCFASPQRSLARPRPGSRPRMTRRPSSAFLGVPSASILRVGAARQMLGHQRPDRSRPGDLEGGEELNTQPDTRASSSRPICRLTQLGGPSDLIPQSISNRLERRG